MIMGEKITNDFVVGIDYRLTVADGTEVGGQPATPAAAPARDRRTSAATCSGEGM